MTPPRKKTSSSDLFVGISAEDFKLLPKNSRIDFRANKQDVDDIKAMAEKLGVNVGEYLVTLHRLAKPRLDEG